LKQNKSDLINVRSFLRPLQRSLTLEYEAGFINILGKEKFFNEFLFESISNLNNFSILNEYRDNIKFFSERYTIYSKLEFNHRKRLIIDTRKFLFKINKFLNSLEDKSESKVIKNNLKDTKLTLHSDVSKIEGVGKVLKDNLNQLGLFNINDLITYFPRTYLDYTNKEKIRNLRPDKLYTCIGYIKKFYLYKSKNNPNLAIMNIIIFDETASIKVTKFFIGKRFRSYTFFSSQKEKFQTGFKLAISGKVKLTEFGKSFVDPQIEILNDSDCNNFKGKILPIYSLSDSIANITFIKILKKVLLCAVNYPEILNKNQLNELSLLPLSQALINIHLPQNQSSLEESKNRLVFNELLLLQLKLLLKRNKRKNIILDKKIRNDKLVFNDFIRNLPFKLTKSQIKVLDEIKKDLSCSSPMSRLLQGDVGSGKTIIAIASLIFIIEQGYQGALMVPTEVLAEQHYKNLINNINPLLITVELLTGNTPQKRRKQIFQDLKNGHVNILVGTHALFEEKVVFNDLGLVIIDEQHRFGVSQRNRLLRKGDNTHFLSMTATPIPRTLALSIYGDLDISQIKEMPPGRIPTITKIINENNLSDLFPIVKKQIEKGKQAYVILPLIEESEKLNLNSAKKTYEYLSNDIFKNFTVGLLHGKLSPDDKNKVIDLFCSNKINILVSTTVIEVGIDVPNASIMIIYNSERFGLSQLHQLRGRVGRDNYQSFCYLVTSENNISLNKRLDVLQKSNDGFYVAEKDLELRGPGQILGYKQSGIPDFVLDNLPKNKGLIDIARNEAIKILFEDPNLESNKELKKILFDKSSSKFIHDFLN
tara:strand:+ start:2461 stop:4914 length:2454 start_codon:yes stop_codon:yes gene_type:complete